MTEERTAIGWLLSDLLATRLKRGAAAEKDIQTDRLPLSTLCTCNYDQPNLKIYIRTTLQQTINKESRFSLMIKMQVIPVWSSTPTNHTIKNRGV